MRLTGVSKTFTGARGHVPVLSPMDLTVAGGSTLALVGPSGCGKSTLLRIAAGLESSDTGTVALGGDSPDILRARGALAVAFQEDALLPWRTLQGNVALGRRLARLPGDTGLVRDLIARVGLAGFEGHRPGALSGGMRQRAAIARCLATGPQVLLLDEPFGAVDELTRRRLNLDLPPLWQQTNATVLMVTHSVSEAVLLSDRVVVLSNRPASVVADISVALDRPRTAKMLSTADFRSTIARVEQALAQAETSALAAQ
ncbi:ABC transporter ATP-binding protein [uncultured Roseobacter sp.]|uniref:ABC transporter ATP-binding protein n=1 Tax=uncultured Roseobacter sp. TaxID=114847 RepID=UPI0026044E08|nr:ABC transporter ATP-binding protein [uncultured Roseobacter sp.]